MNLLKLFKQPEYFYRPRQVALKLRRSFQRHRPVEDVTLPWGATIRIRPDEHIGSRIWHRGLFDIVVLEAITRLADPGEVALDIGANIGQMTSLLSGRLGSGGRVLAFEPHPAVFALLAENVSRLKANPANSEVIAHNVALSNFEGSATLDLGPSWGNNQGLARLSDSTNGSGQNNLKVTVTTVDKIVGPEQRIGVCKLDVEGHEIKVLEGASAVLSQRRLRDIIFEDLGPYPGPVQQRLLDLGFTLFSLQGRLNRPILNPKWSEPTFDGELEGADFLATLEPDRAISRFSTRGWRVLT
jgi:FkbM family methyltransferase